MRAADPARTPPHAALSARAEQDLVRIVRNEAPPRRIRSAEHGRRNRRIVLAAAIVAIIVLIQHGVGVTGTTPPAIAATLPILQGDGQLIPLGSAVTRGVRALTTNPADSKRGSSYSAWYVNTDVSADGTPISYVSPQDVTMTWNPDLSGRFLAVAAQPLVDADAAQAADVPNPGTVLDDSTFKAGEAGIAFQTSPPTTEEAMRKYLVSGAGVKNDRDPLQVLDAATQLLNEWRLGSRAQTALLKVLGGLDGITPLGSLNDRLHRNGIGFVARSDTDHRFEAMFSIDIDTGALLTVERIYLGGVAEYTNVKAPSVVSYIAWK